MTTRVRTKIHHRNATGVEAVVVKVELRVLQKMQNASSANEQVILVVYARRADQDHRVVVHTTEIVLAVDPSTLNRRARSRTK